LRKLHGRLPSFDQDWCEALKKSRLAEQRADHDPETFDDELQTEWHLRKEANLFLRLELEQGALVACTRDPKTGDVLQLPAKDWLPDSWSEYVPAGIWSDFIKENSFDAPGPAGTFIHGSLRRVFFISDEFEIWFKSKFNNAIALDSAAPLTTVNVQAARRVSAHRKEAVKEAIKVIWGENGPSFGAMEGQRLEKINNWLKSHGRATTTNSTIKRALIEMR
jgi:hypothetical protein